MRNPFLTKKRVRKIFQFYNSEKGLKRIPYGLGSSLINWFCKTRFAQEKFFVKKIQLLDEYLSLVPHRPDRNEIATGFLRTNFLHGWRTSSLSRLSDKAFNKRIVFNGLDIFESHYKRGNGIVLLASHYGLPAMSVSLFPRLGYDDFYTIMGERGAESMKIAGLGGKTKPKMLVFTRDTSSELFKQLFKAKEILENGGILHLLGDGYHGRSNVSMEFFGKIRGWRSTFAELGLGTGAAIIPLLIIPGGKGKLFIEFHQALDHGDETMNKEDRIAGIVRQYKEMLEQRWEEKPQYINGGFMNMFIRQVSASHAE